MIQFMIGVMTFFMACFGVLVFFCACMLTLCVLDYIFDSDIKGYLTKFLGERRTLKKIRKRSEELVNRMDEPTYAEKHGYRHM